MVKHKAASILKGSIENKDDDLKYNIGKASIDAPPSGRNDAYATKRVALNVLALKNDPEFRTLTVPRKYKHIKDEKKNRDRNVLLAIENLISQIGNEGPSTLREILWDFHRTIKPKWWDK